MQRENGETLRKAASDGDLDTIRALFCSSCPPNISFVGPRSRTPLQIAYHNGHLDVVEYLVEHDANLRYLGPEGLQTLMYAYMFWNQEK